MPLIVSMTLGETCVDIYTDGVDTVFRDGTNVWATPQGEPSYAETAQRLGYGDDLLQMCQDHETLHTVLAVLEGRPWSPTLWHLVHPPHWQHWREEEAAVMTYQAYLRRTGTSVMDLAARMMRDF